MSQFGSVGFNKTLNRKYLRMRYDMMKNFTSSSHLIVRLPPTLEEVGIRFLYYTENARNNSHLCEFQYRPA